MPGNDRTLAEPGFSRWRRRFSAALRFVLALAVVTAFGTAVAQSLYKYRGPDGEWVFTDRDPGGGQDIEVRELSRGAEDPRVSLYYQVVGTEIQLYGRNEFHAPVQVGVEIEELRGVRPPSDGNRRFLLPARQDTYLLSFVTTEDAQDAHVAYRYRYLIGDPAARHRPARPYRAPFAVARTHTITQAYPYAMTHGSADAAHAVDIAMPVGTDVYAARGGIVVDVASTNFADSLEPDGAEANIVRILHDDGTYSIYAHLNWNAIRVRPGDVVERGEYIADSGNTGFSSGPHLHFVVVRNADMKVESVPIVFEGANGAAVTPEMGMELAAY